MPSKCCILHCKNYTRSEQGISFFRFPKVRINVTDERKLALLKKQRLAWREALRPKDVDDKKLDVLRICSDHFINGKPAKYYDVDNPDWKPQVKLGYKKTNSCVQQKYNRYRRLIERNKRTTDRVQLNQIELQMESSSIAPELQSCSVQQIEIPEIRSCLTQEIELPIDSVTVDTNHLGPESRINVFEPIVSIIVNTTDPDTLSRNNLFETVLNNDNGQKSTLESTNEDLYLLPASFLPVTSTPVNENLSDSMRCSSRITELQNDNEILLRERNSFIYDKIRCQKKTDALLKEKTAFLKEKDALIRELEREKILILKENNKLRHKNFLLQEELEKHSGKYAS